MSDQSRSFLVHLEDDVRHCRSTIGESFEHAALSFAEDLHIDQAEVRVVVIDVSDGRRQCFHIDQGAADAAPCG